MKKLASATDPLWYKDAVIYELHVRAFCDSNGDGIGDFPGLISKLDYLQDLGVTCLWLLPFFPSPLRDDGYDIANYTDVNPSYGTLGDFKAFLDAAHARNLQVMIELVINHTSDQHPWFKASRLALVEVPEMADAADLANAFAPEHLELAGEGAEALAGRITTAGCVFVGAGSATAFGDYAAGSNHVLPTGGTGRFSGPLGPGAFRRRIANVEVPPEAAAALNRDGLVVLSGIVVGIVGLAIVVIAMWLVYALFFVVEEVVEDVIDGEFDGQ